MLNEGELRNCEDCLTLNNQLCCFDVTVYGRHWSARDLAKLLGYTEYGKFKNAIKKAETACENSDQEVADHFAHVGDS